MIQATRFDKVLRSSAASAEQALTLIQLCPPELIFLTARRTKLDQVLGMELGADSNVTRPFGLGARLTRIKAAIRCRHGSIRVDRWTC